MKKFLFVSFAFLSILCMTSCSKDDDGNYESLLRGEYLFIDEAEEYLNGQNIASYHIGVQLKTDGTIQGYTTEWERWSLNENTIIIYLQSGGTEMYEVTNIDEKTGEFTAQCNLNKKDEIDYRILFGHIDSDKYD